MRPTLEPGQLVVVNEGAYRASRVPQRGEIVAARPPLLGGKAIVKRIAGLPHESVRLHGQVWHLGEDEYLLLGDDRQDSLDSRRLGPIGSDDLLGRVWLRVWPPTLLRRCCLKLSSHR